MKRKVFASSPNIITQVFHGLEYFDRFVATGAAFLDEIDHIDVLGAHGLA